MAGELPPACPGSSGTVLRVDLKRCWADARLGQRVVSVVCLHPGTGRLGLCKEHEEELLDA